MPRRVSPLEQARRQRAELRGSINALEAALAAPVPGRASAWVERVYAALAELDADFREHVAVTEHSGGLYAGVLASAPRLGAAVRRLIEEHEQLRSRIDTLLADLDGLGPDPDAAGLREQGTGLLGDLVRHRQRGSDLVYEAYEVDIGGGD